MKLLRFRVTGFRSVKDSGWIEVDQLASLIGTNESGKTNLLLPLWKLNPANGGEISLSSDCPRTSYASIRSQADPKPVFISAEFELSEALAAELTKFAGAPISDLRRVLVKRNFSGTYYISFPDDAGGGSVEKSKLADLLQNALVEIKNVEPEHQKEYNVRKRAIDGLEEILVVIESIEGAVVTSDVLESQNSKIQKISAVGLSKVSKLRNTLLELQKEVDRTFKSVNRSSTTSSQEARNRILKELPNFVYYSNYGNLDSEIYLPHVIENLERKDLGAKEEAKARTLRVLFQFVKLKPLEIQELGKESANDDDWEELEKIAENKKQRDILLQSAGHELTGRFKDWWKQGNYRFRFSADGNHFRIWVSDDLRPEEIELEGRSTGLQWFLSFYLIFLVESEAAHKKSILLLDEPGLSLHPLAQRDLSRFFENLSAKNQLIYTTHSPFLLDADRLENVHAVYVGEDGTTEVSQDLRAPGYTDNQRRSIYPVFTALGLSVAETMLIGCLPIVVEGASDQLYLEGIKAILAKLGLFTQFREIVFVPGEGTKSIKVISALLSAREGDLPFVVVDSDVAGRAFSKSLKESLYLGREGCIYSIGDFIDIENAEIEDLLPPRFLRDVITKYFRGPEEDFCDFHEIGKPMVHQVEQYAQKHNLTLPRGWKHEIAKKTKERMLKFPDRIDDLNEYVPAWQRLFASFGGNPEVIGN